MKKILFVLCLSLFVLFVGRANADYVLIGDKSVKIYVIVNETSNAVRATISTSTIDPGKDRILGYEIGPTGLAGASAASRENYIALYDGASTTTALFAESEASTGSSKAFFYPCPKDITSSSGLTVAQGAWTIATIFYEVNVPH